MATGVGIGLLLIALAALGMAWDMRGDLFICILALGLAVVFACAGLKAIFVL